METGSVTFCFQTASTAIFLSFYGVVEQASIMVLFHFFGYERFVFLCRSVTIPHTTLMARVIRGYFIGFHSEETAVGCRKNAHRFCEEQGSDSTTK